MKGADIFDLIKSEHNKYVGSDKADLIQPSLELTTHEGYKLLEHIGWQCQYANNLRALLEGDIQYFFYFSVKVTTKESLDDNN